MSEALTDNALAVKKELLEKGFTVINAVYTGVEIKRMLTLISNAGTSGETFRKSAGLFAIRQLLKEIPELLPFIFNHRLKHIINEMPGKGYFPVKSIYFDKPGESNWFVAYHQDLTISVAEKKETEEFNQWTVKHGQFAVQPPLGLLENIFTIRIHLDETNEYNGALKVINGSHSKGIYRPETIGWDNEKESVCDVPKGGVMIMKPLLLHSSGRTTNNTQRRVIHIEFSNRELPNGLQWSEKTIVPC